MLIAIMVSAGQVLTLTPAASLHEEGDRVQ